MVAMEVTVTQEDAMERIETDTRKSPAMRFYSIQHDNGAHCVIAIDTFSELIFGLHVCSLHCTSRLIAKRDADLV